MYSFVWLCFVLVCRHRATGEGGMNREEAPGKSPEDMYIQQKVRVLLMLKKMGSNVGRPSGQARPLHWFWAGLNGGPSTSNANLSPNWFFFFFNRFFKLLLNSLATQDFRGGSACGYWRTDLYGRDRMSLGSWRCTAALCQNALPLMNTYVLQGKIWS